MGDLLAFSGEDGNIYPLPHTPVLVLAKAVNSHTYNGVHTFLL